MKQLMLGNEAVARGLYEAGCSFVSSYPGTPSTEITEAAAKYAEIYAEWAPNEKVAMEAAFGACLAGKRSFCGMKHVGLNVVIEKKLPVAFFVTCVISGLICSLINTFTLYVDSKMFGYYSYAMVFGALVTRLITGMIASAGMGIVAQPIVLALRKAKIF